MTYRMAINTTVTFSFWRINKEAFVGFVATLPFARSETFATLLPGAVNDDFVVAALAPRFAAFKVFMT